MLLHTVDKGTQFVPFNITKRNQFMKMDIMTPEQVARSLAIPDLSDPKNGIHAVNLVLDRIIRKFSSIEEYP
ncbi:MAG: hypothetical protein Q7K40_00325, partial [bacterium]|nr:hypothetical protein [bacterium]